LHPQTVAIYLRAGQFPERAPHPSHGRVIEPYLDYLRRRWEQGEHNGRLLFEEIRAQGYPACLTEVYLALQRLLHAWTNSQPGSRQRGATVSVVSPQANPVVAFQSKTNGWGAAVCAKLAGAECLDCPRV
ncbi:MAG TPA: hypothetical protein VKR83_02385, partial [Ktedonobacteraceae bacterium]|nr:hypothetical protein [Ktedonobacteraceae bacterium]